MKFRQVFILAIILTIIVVTTEYLFNGFNMAILAIIFVSILIGCVIKLIMVITSRFEALEEETRKFRESLDSIHACIIDTPLNMNTDSTSPKKYYSRMLRSDVRWSSLISVLDFVEAVITDTDERVKVLWERLHGFIDSKDYGSALCILGCIEQNVGKGFPLIRESLLRSKGEYE